MKKHILKCTALLLTAILLCNYSVLSVGASITEDNFKEQSLDIEQAIEVLDPYVKIVENDDGNNEFVLDAPKSVKNEVGTEILTFAKESIEDINKDVASNEVAITDNGTVYNPNDDSLCIQGGNVDKFKTYWWGYRRWACRSCAANIQDGFSKISTGAWGLASAGGLLTLTPAAAIGVGAAIGGIYSAVMYGWISTDIGTTLRNNPKKGVIISLYLACAYSVKHQ